ncbi:uncharacterized protein LOC133201830 [Saccostrea echinata]|uniref:uncharacterized protein LOC133201830 n=1 Tax=Saccostrea echinata TaxID=191078 RepID=UPI002A80BAC9|nr:uncharacterized protein LOC133201830 [Saccostrea echinata]
MKSQLNIRDSSDDTIFHTNLENEIFQWRSELRAAEYLSNPFSSTDHTSLCNKSLDKELVNFSQKCKNNRQHYIKEVSKNNSVKLSLSLEPIFFTSLERTHFHSIESRTKPEIAAKIEEQIEKLLDLDFEAGEDRKVQWKRDIKNGGKKMYINFYKELLEVVESSQDVMKDEESDPEDEDLPDSVPTL